MHVGRHVCTCFSVQLLALPPYMNPFPASLLISFMGLPCVWLWLPFAFATHHFVFINPVLLDYICTRVTLSCVCCSLLFLYHLPNIHVKYDSFVTFVVLGLLIFKRFISVGDFSGPLLCRVVNFAWEQTLIKPSFIN